MRIPTLSERADDLRAMMLDRVARLGMAQFGETRALDTPVLAELLEHDWPGNEDELNQVLQRLVLASRSALITLDDLERLGMPSFIAEASSATPPLATRSARPPARVAVQRRR